MSDTETSEVPQVKIHVRRNGSYFVDGPAVLLDSEGSRFEVEDKFWLCRCGHSENKPFCDGTHKKVGFQSDVRVEDPERQKDG